ncbi:LysR family transcriptional regulator [Infirmifilum lucidum]|uniref:LysR family transcriptional regulator n=1 Tax=Infirmifilum lucidum TaxID=2776706 RepID=A0A7L9FHF8_9CREN|nr:LysR family transcriptional regulator [Infirmifilum lucidum]QOJ78433.1 LysR family transcriptional regulator [Infirmifilum lucidum]
MPRISVRAKVWISIDGEPLLGEGGYRLLKKIEETNSLVKAAKELGVSYSFAWRYMHRIEKLVGKRVVDTYRGGTRKGGATLTEEGRLLIRVYEEVRDQVDAIIKKIEEANLQL